MADNTLRPYGWRGSRVNLDQRPVKDEAETSTDGTFGSDLQVPDEDSPVVTAAREVKHVDASGSVEHHYPGSRERTGAQAGEDNEFGQEQPRWKGARRSPSFKQPQDPTNPEYESIGGDLAGEGAENTAADQRAGGLRGRNRRPFLSEPGSWGAKQPSASRRVEAHPVFDRALEDKDGQKPSGARPGQPAEHLHVQRPSQARKALALALGVVRKFTAGPAAVALSDEETAMIAADQPSEKIDPAKARKILRDKEVRGHPLTEKQKGMFGAAAGREKKEAPNVFRQGSRYARPGGAPAAPAAPRQQGGFSLRRPAGAPQIGPGAGAPAQAGSYSFDPSARRMAPTVTPGGRRAGQPSGSMQPKRTMSYAEDEGSLDA